MPAILRSDFIYVNEDGATSPRLKNLIDRGNYQRNTNFLANYLAGMPTEKETFCLGVDKRFPSMTPVSCSTFEEAFSSSCRQLESSSITVALSGGLDSQFIALELRRRGFHVKAVSLKSDIHGYCEWDKVQAFALKHSIDLIPITVKREDFYQSLPEMMSIVEEPIYNLHAVSKFLLARGLNEIGIFQCLTGDGADQVFAAKEECDLYRLTKKCFHAFGIDLVTPLATPEMVSFTSLEGPQDKRALYRMDAEKSACLFPDEGKAHILNLSLTILERNLLCAE
jgi:asparagine synthetase B (glutamine-hydrolysing)